MPRALLALGAVRLVERGLVHEPDTDLGRRSLQRRRRLQRVRPAFELARPGDQRQRQTVAETDLTVGRTDGDNGIRSGIDLST